MINLGLTQRWAGRPGAVERTAKALRRRSSGVGAAKYIRHIPRDFSMPEGVRTCCGRIAASVNCIVGRDEINASDICGSCSKWVIRLESDGESK